MSSDAASAEADADVDARPWTSSSIGVISLSAVRDDDDDAVHSEDGRVIQTVVSECCFDSLLGSKGDYDYEEKYYARYN